MELAAARTSLPDERLLVRELLHRINNEFTSAASMIALAANHASSAEAKAVLTSVMGRLEEYAGVHRALQMPTGGAPVDAATWLRELCRSISKAKLDRKNIDLVLVERSLSLNAEQCWMLGMIINELITNAARHAFDEAGGEIRVEIVQRGRLVECHVSDDGTAPFFVRRGRGLKIIEDLAESLDGRFEQHFGVHGSASVVIFPARN
jgi:two-component sensor histidine kinase